MASAGAGSPMPPAGDAPAKTSCDHCGKTQGPFKDCAKCKSADYCNRDCQKAHWKVHKKECAQLASENMRLQAVWSAITNGEASSSSGPTPIPQRQYMGAHPHGPYLNFRLGDLQYDAIFHNKYLHKKSETVTFEILIDTLRMRQADAHSFQGIAMKGTIYDKEPSSEKAFRQFIEQAHSHPVMLQPWWTETMVDRCVLYSRSSKNFSLEQAVDKADIQKKWDDDLMPMKLRMLGERIYGKTLFTEDCGGILTTYMMLERGLWPEDMMDMIPEA